MIIGIRSRPLTKRELKSQLKRKKEIEAQHLKREDTPMGRGPALTLTPPRVLKAAGYGT